MGSSAEFSSTLEFSSDMSSPLGPHEVMGKFLPLTFDGQDIKLEVNTSCNKEREENQVQPTSRHSNRHPIIRLINTVKLCIQFICIIQITIVPIARVAECYQFPVLNNFTTPTNNHHSQQQLHQNAQTSHFTQQPQQQFTMQTLHHFNQHHNQIIHPAPPDESWPMNLLEQSKSKPLELPGMTRNMLNSNTLNLPIALPAHRRDERSQAQQSQQQQQQQPQLTPRPAKLLADYVTNQGQRILKNLVNTSIADLVAQSTTRIANSNKQLQQQGSPFPTMGKLYTLLFPAATSTTQPPTSSTQSSELNVTQTDPETEAAAAADMYLSESPRSKKEMMEVDEKHIINLSAPYDSRPRASTLATTRISSSSADVGDEWRSRPDTQVNEGLEHDGLLYATPPLDAEEGTSEPGPIQASELTDAAESMGSFESSSAELLSPTHQQPQVGAEEPVVKSEEVAEQQHHQQQVADQMQQAAEQDAAAQYHNEHSQEEFAVLYGPRKVISYTSSAEDSTNHTGEIQSQEPHDTQQVIMDDENLLAQTLHHQQQQHPMEEHQRRQNDSQHEIHVNPYAQMDDIHTDSFKPNESKHPNVDESFFTAHLPSQYDSVLHMPPDGYYDDYFKPSSSSQQIALHTNNSPPVPPNSEGSFSSSLRNSPIPYGSNMIELGTSSQQRGGSNSSSPRLSSPSSFVPETEYNSNGPIGFYVPQQQQHQRQSPQEHQHVERPTTTIVEHRVEYVPASNRSSQQEYEIQHVYERQLPNGNNSIVSLETISPHELRNSSSGSRYPSEDRIQVIMANTANSSRDPRSKEKVINYTSEGQNITRIAGKSPRNNFVNKDMNEFPPDGPPVTGHYQPQPPPLPPSVPQQHRHPSSSVPAHFIVGNLVRATENPASGRYFSSSPQRLEGEQQVVQLVQLSPIDEKDDVGRQELEQQNERAIVEATGDKTAGRYAVQRIVKQQVGGQNNVRIPASSEEPIHTTAMIVENSPEPARNEEKRRVGGGHYSSRQPHSQQTKRDKRAKSKNSQNNKQKNGQNLRSQVTQVNFSPRDLPMNPPNEHTTENPVEALVELPSKVKKLREKQPDKNELMNELLTALDRVKVAIYKLQPLTAKMNAIYRKSVTSNTRDLIMDNHKGTYAKRYPPGDYDDSYDKMHPSDLLNRQISGRKNEQQSQQVQQQQQQQQQPVEQQHQSVPQVGAEIDPSESVARATYVPAPREILEQARGNLVNATNNKVIFELSNTINEGASKIIATGIGRRLGDGRLAKNQLSLTTSPERVSFQEEDDEEAEEEKLTLSSTLIGNSNSNSNSSALFPSKQVLDELNSPVFGYRITIYQTPDDSELLVDDNRAANSEKNPLARQFSYQLDGLTELPEKSSGRTVSVEDEDEQELGAESRDNFQNGDDEDEEEETMVTSESSLVASSAVVGEQLSGEASELKKNGKSEVDERVLKEKEDKKKKEAQRKSLSRKRKEELEGKRKKEYKKIKHNKGILSKEKKTLKRDKHVKAHDRGAAKEKALKERTQIEFFEREQIVDDEFEKGKKSSAKANWQSGHDSRKVLKLGDSPMGSSGSVPGDTMSSGGSHYVKHEPKDMVEKGVGAESSSGKKSSKAERKQLEAKGKKFKGWREKGYKIITETEFIDRGSLHDSAYKKRDKGAAQHLKYKKQEASSEGHQGTLLEHHKKSNKKEEKRSKSDEKRDYRSDLKKKLNASEKKSSSAGDSKKSAPSVSRPVVDEDADFDQSALASNTEQLRPVHKSSSSHTLPIILAINSTSFKIPTSSDGSNSSSSINRLNNSAQDYHEQPVRLLVTAREEQSRLANISAASLLDKLSSKLQLLNDTSDSNRRSDGSSVLSKLRSAGEHNSSARQMANDSNRGNQTILDIVDNLTGRQVNKTKIGTYELDEHTGSVKQLNSSTPLVKISSSLAKYFPILAKKTTHHQLNNHSLHDDSSQKVAATGGTSTASSVTTTSTTTSRPTRQQVAIQQQERSENNSVFNDSRFLNRHRHQLANLARHSNNNNLHHNYNNNNYDHSALLRARGLNHNYDSHENHNYNQNYNHKTPQLVSSDLYHQYHHNNQNNLATDFNSRQRRQPMITAEQAEAAAQLLQLVHRVNHHQSHHHKGPVIGMNGQPSANLIDLPLLQQSVGPIQRAAFLATPSLVVNSYQPTPIFGPQTHLNFVNSNSHINPFAHDQYADYETAHNFLTDS